LPTHILN
jgi:hypothetical protein